MTNTPDLVPEPLDLAVIGIGCLFPKAENLGAYWANIKNMPLMASVMCRRRTGTRTITSTPTPKPRT